MNLFIFYCWMRPVPYLKLFWAGPVKKPPCIWMWCYFRFLDHMRAWLELREGTVEHYRMSVALRSNFLQSFSNEKIYLVQTHIFALFSLLHKIWWLWILSVYIKSTIFFWIWWQLSQKVICPPPTIQSSKRLFSTKISHQDQCQGFQPCMPCIHFVSG